MDVSILTGNDFSDRFHQQMWRIGTGKRIWIQYSSPKYKQEFDTEKPLEEDGYIEELLVR